MFGYNRIYKAIDFGSRNAKVNGSTKLINYYQNNKLVYLLIILIGITGAIYMTNVKYKCQLESDGDGTYTCWKYRKINGGNWSRINSWSDSCPAPPTCPN